MRIHQFQHSADPPSALVVSRWRDRAGLHVRHQSRRLQIQKVATHAFLFSAGAVLGAASAAHFTSGDYLFTAVCFAVAPGLVWLGVRARRALSDVELTLRVFERFAVELARFVPNQHPEEAGALIARIAINCPCIETYLERLAMKDRPLLLGEARALIEGCPPVHKPGQSNLSFKSGERT